jgi:hypothetical protein
MYALSTLGAQLENTSDTNTSAFAIPINIADSAARPTNHNSGFFMVKYKCR